MTSHPSAPARAADVRRLRGASCWLAGVCLAAGALSACAPLLMGGAAVGGAMIASDRRTSGTQVEDQTIEMKAAGRVLVVAPARDEKLERSAANLPRVEVILADSLNTVDVLKADTLLITEPALATMTEVYA